MLDSRRTTSPLAVPPRRLLSFLRPHRKLALWAPVLMATEVALDLLQPRFVQRIIDRGIVPGDSALVTETLAWMLGTALVAMAAGVACAFCAVRAAHGLGSDLRQAAFDQLQRLKLSELEQRGSGQLITRITSDVGQIQEMTAMLLRGVVRMTLLLVGSVAMALIVDVRLGWLFLLLLPIVTTTLYLTTTRSFPLYRHVQEGLERLNTVLQENLAGVRIIKVLGRGRHEIERFRAANLALVERTTGAAWASAWSSPLLGLTLNAAVVGVLWWGSEGIALGTFSVGAAMAFIGYLNQASSSLTLLSNMLVQIARGRASAERVAEFLALEAAGTTAPGTPVTASGTPVRGEIAFQGVAFSHGRGTAPVLRNLDFRIAPGQRVALLGPTGAGKSTLLHLLARFYEVSAGRITIDGVDLRDLPEPELRRAISFVFQEPVLFRGSIRENIDLTETGASLERIEAAARAAMAHDFIVARTEAYETLLGQRGVNLSGGQKQRIGLGRGLLPEAPILILDDTTSAVDGRTEARIFANLAQRSRARTSIVVTQRIEHVADFDRILLLDQGELIGDGTHASLLAQSENYRRLVASQASRPRDVFESN